ncbi:MAG: LapA family protein [Acidimicrobiales bacterium]
MNNPSLDPAGVERDRVQVPRPGHSDRPPGDQAGDFDDTGAVVDKARPSSRAWVGVGVALVCLIIVAVFVLQNLDSTRVSFFSLHWRAPLAVDLLLAAVLGGLVVFGFGSVRIIQLRRAGRRRGHATG